MRKLMVLLVASMLTSSLAMAQIHKVTGKVRDQSGDPVPFVTVKLSGTNQAVAADAEGNFSIKAKDGDILTVTGVGVKKQQFTVSGDVLAISLTRTSSDLSEITVTTALGLKRTRNSLPFATQQVSGDEINRTPTTNFVDNLSGKVAGLQITAANTMGGSTNAILRGMKSLTQSNQALFVVDGVPYDNSNLSSGGFDLGNAASDINPEDIESVSVLKGAAASALYGSRASNGVILITTKKGSSKAKGYGVEASFGVTVGSPDKSTLPTYQTQYGQGAGSGGASPGNPNPFFYFETIPGVNNGGAVPIVITNNDAAVGPAYNPSLMVYNWDAFSPTNANFHKATPWMPAANHNPTDFFVTPVTETENIAVSGGDDKGTFRLSYTRDDGKDFMPNSSLDKDLLSINATHNITDKITVGGDFNYSDNRAVGRYLYPYTGSTNIMTDFRQWWPTNVNIKELKNDYFTSLTNVTWNWQNDGSYQTNALGNLGRPAYHDNPYWDRYQNYEADSRTRYFGNANVNYKITSYLNLMGRVSEDQYNQLVETRNNVGSQAVSFYDRANSSFTETNYDLLLNFDKNIGSDFNVKALLGGNVRQQNLQGVASGTSGGLVVPGFYSVSNSVNLPGAPSEYYQRKEVDGIFAGATIAYKQFLTLDGTIRRDKSSTLPSANNTYYYPSVSANFVFTKLIPQAQWYGKVWANFAQVGGDAPIYATQNTYAAGAPFNGETTFQVPTTNNNANLKPEQNTTYEAGIETNFFHNRLGFTADYYRARESSEIIPNGVSTASGFNTFFVNGGTIQNQGVEATLSIMPVRTKDFSWTMVVNWSKNVNKTISLYGGQPSFIITSYQNSIQEVAEVGKSYGIIRGSDFVYKNGQKVVDATGHYEWNSNPLSDIGNINPDWMGGITNTFTYKNVALSFLVDVRQGGQLYSLDMDYGSLSGLYPRTAGFNDKGIAVRTPIAQGGGIIVPGVNDAGKPNTVRLDESDQNAGLYSFSSAFGPGGGEPQKTFVYDASYVKLREVNITYSLPKKTVQKLGFIRGVDIALAGRNLWIIHKNEPYADPEQGQAAFGSGSGVQNGSMGFQNGAYPLIRTVSAVVKLKF